MSSSCPLAPPHIPSTTAAPNLDHLPASLHRALSILRTRPVRLPDRILFWIAFLWLIATLCEA